MGVGGTRLVVGCILLEGTRVGVGGTHLGVVFILLGVIPLGVVYFLLDPGSFRDLVDLLRERECPSIHLVLETPEGLLGQARSTLPVRVSSLLAVALRGPAAVSSLQGLVHQVLMDRARTDQGQMAQGQMAQGQMAQVRMAQARTAQVRMAQA